MKIRRTNNIAARSGYTVKVIGYDNYQTEKRTVFVTVNSIAEAPDVSDNWETGSVMWDVSTRKWYGLNSPGEWVEQTAGE